MITFILATLYLFLPAYCANMAPIVAAQLRLPGRPIAPRRLGNGKTWRGVYGAYVAALFMLFLQALLQDRGIAESLRLIDYAEWNLFLLAVPFGLGAIGGDIAKSFVKRSFDIPCGVPWFPFDQLDFVIGAVLVLSPIVPIAFSRVLLLLLLTPFLHLTANILSYLLGWKDVWW